MISEDLNLIATHKYRHVESSDQLESKEPGVEDVRKSVFVRLQVCQGSFLEGKVVRTFNTHPSELFGVA